MDFFGAPAPAAGGETGFQNNDMGGSPFGQPTSASPDTASFGGQADIFGAAPPVAASADPSFGGGSPFGGSPAPVRSEGSPAGMGFGAPADSSPVQEQPKRRFQIPETPAPIKEWREKQAALLAEKDKAEREARDKQLKQAQTDLQTFYAERKKGIASTVSANKSAERAFVEERDSKNTAGREWERMANLVDLTSNKEVAKDERGRMKSILISLKNKPLQAAA